MVTSFLFFIFCYYKQMENCIFCKIVKGEIHCNKIYEDTNFLAFLDIEPVANGHILIIPKEHVLWMQEVNDKSIGDIFILTKKLMLAIKKGLGCDYIQEGVYGEEIQHFHIHLIPRYFEDNLPKFPRKKYKDDTEKNEIISKITQAL